MNSIINTMLVTLTIVILFNQICISDSIMPTGFENIYIGMTKSEFKTARPTAIEDTFMTFGGDLPNAIFREQLEQGSYFEMVKYYIEENILIDIQFLKDGCFHINHDGQPGDCSGFAETRCAFLRSCIDKYGNNYDVNVWHSEAMNIYDGHLRWNDQNIIIYAHYSPSK